MNLEWSDGNHCGSLSLECVAGKRSDQGRWLRYAKMIFMFAYHVMSYRSHTIHFLVSLRNFRRWTPPIQWRRGVLHSSSLDFRSFGSFESATCRTFALWFDDYLVDGWHCSLAVWSSAHQCPVGVGRCWKRCPPGLWLRATGKAARRLQMLTACFKICIWFHLMQDAGRKLFDVAWNWTKRCTVIYTLNVIEC